jgi:hypothetical protein
MLTVGCGGHTNSGGTGNHSGSHSGTGVPYANVSGACDCRDVTCAIPCPSPLCASEDTLCANSCVNVQTDPNNCGYCGVTCAAGQGCQDGGCGPVADAAPLADTALVADASNDSTTEALSIDAGGADDSMTSDTADVFSSSPSDGSAVGVTCGTATCNPPENVCCFDGILDGDPVALVLTCHDSCPVGSGGFACTGPQNCSDGQICCAPTGALLNAQCTRGACAGWQFCQSNADCPVGDTCSPVPPTGIPNVSIMAGICGPVDASLVGE